MSKLDLGKQNNTDKQTNKQTKQNKTKKRPSPIALTSRNNNNNKLMVLTQSIHPLTLVITHFYYHRLNQASVLVPCIHLCRLSNALEINQANFLIQLALQLSSLNSLDRILG